MSENYHVFKFATVIDLTMGTFNKMAGRQHQSSDTNGEQRDPSLNVHNTSLKRILEEREGISLNLRNASSSATTEESSKHPKDRSMNTNSLPIAALQPQPAAATTRAEQETVQPEENGAHSRVDERDLRESLLSKRKLALLLALDKTIVSSGDPTRGLNYYGVDGLHALGKDTRCLWV